MTKISKKVLLLLVAVSMVATLALTACGGGSQAKDTTEDTTESAAQTLEGDVTGEIGKEYQSKWFTFSVDALTKTDSIPELSAGEGNSLVVATVTITNTSGSEQLFGTFDWLVDDDSLAEYIYPVDPLNDKMMPAEFALKDGETATYDVVVEFPADLANPFFMYIEADENGQTYSTFKIPIK